MQKLFENVDKFKSLKRREESLDKQLDDLDITLKEQETREALSKVPVDETTKKFENKYKFPMRINKPKIHHPIINNKLTQKTILNNLNPRIKNQTHLKRKIKKGYLIQTIRLMN